MFTKITLRFLMLFLGLSSLAIAENKAYLVSDTPITVNYIICPSSKPIQECSANDITPFESPVILNSTQKIYAINNIPKHGFAKIVSVVANQRSYVYSDKDPLPCALPNGMAVKFEVYDNIIICNSQAIAIAQ